jgi:2-dehydro-3-deoxyphosphogluconate aldolase/(4S)-4-hydroxy-2-oxoglutarate aldolase
VVILKTLEDTVPTLAALRAGGLPMAEIAFRTPFAAEALRIAHKQFPDLLIGAGTIVNGEQATHAIAAGAAFLVSPGFSSEVAKLCLQKGIPYLPGCATPTEIMRAMSYGISVVKLFPAEAYGGLKAIKAISAAFPSVRFVPTGGISEENLIDYLSAPRVLACGGSWMVKGTQAEIAAKTAAAVAVIRAWSSTHETVKED